MSFVKYLIILICFHFHGNFLVAIGSFRLILPETIVHYVSPNSNTIHSIKFDSIRVVNNDSIFYPYKVVSNFTIPLPDTLILRNHWIGKEIIKFFTGDYAIINSQNDTIWIYPKTPINLSWILFKYPNGNVVKATVKSINQSVILTYYNETIKTIRLHVEDSNGTQISGHPLNNKTFSFGESLGFINIPQFDLFPNEYKTLNIAGIDNWQLGITSLTSETVFDMEDINLLQVKEIFQHPFFLWNKYDKTVNWNPISYTLYPGADSATIKINEVVKITGSLKWPPIAETISISRVFDTTFYLNDLKFLNEFNLALVALKNGMWGIIQYVYDNDICNYFSTKIIYPYYHRTGNLLLLSTGNEFPGIKYHDHIGGPFMETDSITRFVKYFDYLWSTFTCGQYSYIGNFLSDNIKLPDYDSFILTREKEFIIVKIAEKHRGANIVTLTDIAGRILFIEKNNSNDTIWIYTADLPSGIYLLRIDFGNIRTEARKIWIN